MGTLLSSGKRASVKHGTVGHLSEERKAELRKIFDARESTQGTLFDRAYMDGLNDAHKTESGEKAFRIIKHVENEILPIIKCDKQENAKLYKLSEDLIKDIKDALPDILRGKKIGKVYADLRERKDAPLRESWKLYPKFLDSYFKRNPKHTLTCARKACARKHDVSLSTVYNHTEGYKKPNIY